MGKLSKAPPEPKLTVGENNGHLAAYMVGILERTGRLRAMRFLSASLMLNVLLACVFAFVLYYGVMYKQHVYFATLPDGRIQELPDLSEPYISEGKAAEWAVEVLTETYSLDFRNYKKTLARVKPYYSRKSWREIEEQIRPLIDSINKERLVIAAVSEGKPKILEQGVARNGSYFWRVEFPLTLTHQVRGGMQTFRWLAQVYVSRANIVEKPEGLEILQFVIRNRS